MFGFLKKQISNFSEKLKNTITKKENKEQKTIPTLNQVTNKPEEKIKSEKKIPKITLQETNKKSVKKSEQKNIIKEKIKENIIEKDNDFDEKITLKPEKKIVKDDKRKLEAKISKTTKLKSFFTRHIELKEKDLEELLFELELSLIESDVEQDTAIEIIEQIKKRLLNQKISTNNINDYLKKMIKEILKEMMTTTKIDLIKKIRENEKPFKIILLGPNGAGKTTTIAKLTNLLQKNGLTCVWAAGDTFRSGAIDQIEEHSKKLNVKLIKQQYGADPTAVAFDAVKSAKANNIDVVLIDTAGRQETNKNLMDELKKLNRVIEPDIKIYVGEAYTGQGLLDMAKEFDESVNLTGFILTKIDTDAKGGTTISLLYKLKKPLLFIGTGQGYNDFEEFEPEFIINKII